MDKEKLSLSKTVYEDTMNLTLNFNLTKTLNLTVNFGF